MTGAAKMIPQVLILMPLIFAVIFFLWHRATFMRRILAVSVLTAVALVSLFGLFLAASGPVAAVLAGGHVAPFGIVLVMDILSAFLLFAVNIVFLSTTLYGFFETSAAAEKIYCLPLIFFLQAGVSLALLTGDFFNLFVAFEVILTASYGLMVLTAEPKKLSGAFTYVLFSMAASYLFLVIAALFYGSTGNLNMAAISGILTDQGKSPFVIAIALLSLLIFGLKAGVFPLYFWLPDSYPVLPASLAGLFGGILTKVGVYAIIRLFVTVFPHDLYPVYSIAAVFAGLTMLMGVIGAVGKNTIKGVLSYHILSQTGYMIFSIAMFTPKAIAAGIFFVLHNILVKSSLFLLGGLGKVFYGTDYLKDMGGLWQAAPFGGFLFLIQAMSLAGVPPFSGFWGKFMIFSEGLALEHWWLVGVGAATSFFTLLSMIKIWTMAFMGPSKVKIEPDRRGFVLAASLLVAFSLFLGLGAGAAAALTEKAASQIFDRSQYIDAVYSAEGKGRKR